MTIYVPIIQDAYALGAARAYASCQKRGLKLSSRSGYAALPLCKAMERGILWR